ncbi:MAG TPA: prepilin-type N-terminal cleavage/methylation domain-containing protein [Verrucomicrobiae bacterium]|nr:prepilin-type N-terminal cleavage/methylation domain-containing protein [Verrucomicrobiae bacterium]
MDRQAGFTLIETLVGAAIAAVMIWALVVMADRLAAGAAAANRRVVASANVGRLVERLSSEAASALAIDVPATDVLGAANSDGHEIDFSTQDGAHRTYAWAYTFDSAAQTLTRYTLNGTGAPVAGDVLSDIDSFSAAAATVTQLGVPSSPAYDPLFAGTHAIDVPGNRLVVVQVVASGVDRSVLLASEDAPTAFTVVVTYTPSPPPVVTPTPSPVPMW